MLQQNHGLYIWTKVFLGHIYWWVAGSPVYNHQAAGYLCVCTAVCAGGQV